MGSIATATVGKNAQPLAPAAVVGATADTVTVVNLDTANTVNLGSQATYLPYPLGPLASVTLTAPVWAQAATVPLLVGMLPGGSNFSPGSLTITGPVTAEITGPVTVEGTVDIGAGSVGITGTVDVAITGTPTVEIGGTPTVNIGNSPAVTITGTPTVDIGNSPTVNVSGTVDVAITGTPAVSISGTPTVDIASGSVDITAGNVDVTGVGGYVAPGAYSLVLNDSTTHAIAGGTSYTTPVYNVQTFQSYTISVQGYCTAQGFLGAPICVPVIVSYFADSAGSVLVDTERWWMWLGNSGGAATPVNGSGPLRGGYISVTIGNVDGSQPADVNRIIVYGAGRSLGESVWQQTPPGSFTAGVDLLTSSAPVVPLPGDDKVLANESSNNIPPSNTYWWPLPLYSGTVSLYYETATALANPFVVATAQGLQYGDIAAGGATQGVVWNPGNTAGTVYEDVIEVGNAPLYIVIHSTSAASTILTFTAQGS